MLVVDTTERLHVEGSASIVSVGMVSVGMASVNESSISMMSLKDMQKSPSKIKVLFVMNGHLVNGNMKLWMKHDVKSTFTSKFDLT